MTLWSNTLHTELSTRTPTVDLAVGGVLALLAAVAVHSALEPGSAYVVAVVLGYLLLAAVIWLRWPRKGWSAGFWTGRQGQPLLTLGWGNRVTLVRGIVVLLVLAALSVPAWAAEHAWLLALLSLAVLSLDGLDGWTARRTGTISAFGARFDMELDAVFILGLACLLVVLDRAGIWVLLLGLMRYAFFAAGYWLAWMRAALPASRRRQAVCVWQVATLLACLPPWLPQTLVAVALSTALGLLVLSFLIDIVWLYRHGKRA
ncbi:MAG: CDP-alcohol phosphatidyltransferase family protein [Natronospirillum sp.]|uniref:CDP-alcohol phosphatidyltransferase family protein n=1 Tax=Natronospirillum sp. TaxID=2812955 RepID=UPI0025CD5628|nr:CDP-alcohol phosphatidyltransferase family protein [Natronospirillum sp.]MCH8551822.1 CDP-alcohol phosphatidyltransferase family protein [Natronospirillum sp.]